MISHVAECRCGAVRAVCEGEPVRVSVCHCLACQRRTGSAFAAQARWHAERIAITGTTKTFVRIADSGHPVTYRFCPECGSTMAYEVQDLPGLIAVPLGAFADPQFPPPRLSFYENRRHAWTAVSGENVEHFD